MGDNGDMAQPVYPIPARLNLTLCVAVAGSMVGLLWGASRASELWLQLLCGLGFAVLGQTCFALIHEAEHSKLHPHRGINDAAGVLLSALFPGAFTVLRAAHLAHHRRNRSEVEFIDYYHPHESRLLKTLKYYALISGVIWIGSPLASLATCFVPARHFAADPERQSGVDLGSFLTFLAGASRRRVRQEVLITLALWALMVPLLGLTVAGLGIAYAAFAFFWASQQYVYHVRTPLHLVEGSFDLRMSALSQRLYLNLNYHLTHHRAVQVPWLYLPQAAQEPPWRPYLSTWLASLRPPRPAAMAWPPRFIARGPLPSPVPEEFRRPR